MLNEKCDPTLRQVEDQNVRLSYCAQYEEEQLNAQCQPQVESPLKSWVRLVIGHIPSMSGSSLIGGLTLVCPT